MLRSVTKLAGHVPCCRNVTNATRRWRAPLVELKSRRTIFQLIAVLQQINARFSCDKEHTKQNNLNQIRFTCKKSASFCQVSATPANLLTNCSRIPDQRVVKETPSQSRETILDGYVLSLKPVVKGHGQASDQSLFFRFEIGSFCESKITGLFW